ncbi:GCG_CRPN prefix-to-repeats domain-containing protein [Bradyrhizobium sp. USDA 4353]
MRAILTSLLLFGALTAGASAMPPAPISTTGLEPMVIQVAGGCGPGWHRGPYGGCRRNFANPAAHACPRGFHIGPYGRCRGNGR